MYDLILVLDGVVIPASTVVGILLNVIGMFFLCAGSRKFKVFSLLLTTLLAFDTIFLISGLMRKIEHYIVPVSKKYLAIYHVAIHSVIRCSAISSIFMVMVMSHARLWAIRKPFFHNSNILSWPERRNIWARYCIPVVIASAVLTLPVFFEFEVSIETNSITPSSLRLHPYYAILNCGVLKFGILGLLPASYLGYVAFQIRWELRESETRMYAFRHQPTTLKPPVQNLSVKVYETESHSMASIRTNNKIPKVNRSISQIKSLRMMYKNMLVFVALHAFRLTTNIGEVYILLGLNNDNEALKMGHGIPAWIGITAKLGELFMVLHSSFGAIIYLNLEYATIFGSCSQHNSKCLSIYSIKRHTAVPIAFVDALVEEETKQISIPQEALEETK